MAGDEAQPPIIVVMVFSLLSDKIFRTAFAFDIDLCEKMCLKEIAVLLFEHRGETLHTKISQELIQK